MRKILVNKQPFRSRQHYYNLLKKFLESEDMWSRFCRRFEESEGYMYRSAHDIYTHVLSEYCRMVAPHMYIMRAFLWTTHEEDPTVWSSLHIKWGILLNKEHYDERRFEH